MPPESPGRHPRVTDEELLKALREHPDPAVTTGELAEDVPLTRRSVLDRLDSLEEDGRVVSKDVGPRAQVWWAVDDDDDGTRVRLEDDNEVKDE